MAERHGEEPAPVGSAGVPSPPVIVVGFDRHPPATSALRAAAGLALRLGADLHVVHVLDVSDAYPDPDADDWEDRTNQQAQQVRSTAQALLADHGGRWSYLARRGTPARALAQAAQDADALMLVLGTPRSGHGSAVAHLLDRPVLAQVLHHDSDVPVLLVPHRS